MRSPYLLAYDSPPITFLPSLFFSVSSLSCLLTDSVVSFVSFLSFFFYLSFFYPRANVPPEEKKSRSITHGAQEPALSEKLRWSNYTLALEISSQTNSLCLLLLAFLAFLRCLSIHRSKLRGYFVNFYIYVFQRNGLEHTFLYALLYILVYELSVLRMMMENSCVFSLLL